MNMCCITICNYHTFNFFAGWSAASLLESWLQGSCNTELWVWDASGDANAVWRVQSGAVELEDVPLTSKLTHRCTAPRPALTEQE